MYITVPKLILNTPKKFLLFIKAYYVTPSLCPTFYKQLGSHIYLGQSLCAKLLMVRTMLQSTKTFDTKLVRYIEWSNVQPCVHHISPIWPHYGHFGPKNSHIWPYLAIGSPSCPKLVEHWLNMVEHRSPHLGWATWTPLHPPK